MSCHAIQTFPILRALQLHRVLKKKIYETEESGRRAVSLGGRTRAAREETHAPLFSLRESFFSFCEQEGSTHRRLAVDWLQTQSWLSAIQWATEIDMLLQTAGAHPSIRPVTSGLTSAAWSAFLLVPIQSRMPLLFGTWNSVLWLFLRIPTFFPQIPTFSQIPDFFTEFRIFSSKFWL